MQVKVIGESDNMLKNKRIELTCPLGHRYVKEMCLSDRCEEPYFNAEEMTMTSDLKNALATESCEECGVMYKPAYEITESTMESFLPDSYLSEDLR